MSAARIICGGAPLLVLVGCAGGGGSGGEHDEIIAATEVFFDAMERRDVELARTVLVPEGVFSSMRENGAGEREIRSFSNEEWMSRLAERRSDVRENYLGRPFVMVEGDVAMLWGEYEFVVDGERRHTGIDVFTLVKTGDGWMIAGGVYSVVPVE